MILLRQRSDKKVSVSQRLVRQSTPLQGGEALAYGMALGLGRSAAVFGGSLVLEGMIRPVSCHARRSVRLLASAVMYSVFSNTERAEMA